MLNAADDCLSTLRDDRTSILHQALSETRADLVNYAALVDVWGGTPRRALTLVEELLHDSIDSIAASLVGQSFVLAARAAADVVEGERLEDSVRSRYHRELLRLCDRATVSPFTTNGRAEGPALEATWLAETARLLRRSSLQLWAAATTAWDELGRPHDSAYCRWRAGQAAMVAGQGTIALRLLRHAGRDAGEHVPLSTAITETTNATRRQAQHS